MSSLSSTHHSPVGAWSGLYFGEPGKGAAIGHEAPVPVFNADLLIGVSRGKGRTACLPFSASALPAGWRAAGAVEQELTPCVNSYLISGAEMENAGVKLRVHTPHVSIPNPKRARSLQYATVPSLLVELTIDNTGSDEAATGFFGVRWLGEGMMRALDWASNHLCGVAVANRFAVGAQHVKGQIFTACGNDFASLAENGVGGISNDGNVGGIVMKVPPRGTHTLVVAFAFHHSGLATYGIDGRYVFGGYFSRIENAVSFTLSAADRIKESCETLDARLSAGQSKERLAILSHAIRQYDACTQLVDVGTGGPPMPQYCMISGARAWRNAINAAVDHLPWELFRNPWVVRNIFDLFTANYSYADQTVFAGDGELREGGMALCHDMGAGASYSPATTSACERGNVSGASGYVTSESVLSAIYMLTSYALTADDTPWSRTRLPFARELLASLENRDHHNAEMRNGILKATSTLCGPKGAESTSFTEMDPTLGAAHGSTYLAAKTFCANILLTTYFQNNNDLHSADYAYAMAQKTATTLAAAFDERRGAFPISLEGGEGISLAILEPLAIPTYLGLAGTFAEYFPSLMEKMKRHAETCLRAGACVDAAGGLKIASHTAASLPSKVAAAYYVMETLLKMDVGRAAPGALAGLLAEVRKNGTPDSRLAAAFYLIRPALADAAQGDDAGVSQ
jgi:hypothetical protein